MARIFDITTTSDTLTLSPDGTGSMVFTVTNTSKQDVRGTLLPRVLDSKNANWLSVAGDAVREFKPGLAHQVKVTAKLPPGTEAGKLRVRLDAASEKNPDDDFTEGPPIGIAVATTPQPVKKGGGVP